MPTGQPATSTSTSKQAAGHSSAVEASGPLNTLRISPAELGKLWQDLDALAIKKQSQREFIRWPFQRASVKIELKQMAGTMTTLSLACRNLSATGIALLHSAYVYPGTACTLHLQQLSGGSTSVAGKVVHCRHVRGLVHEIGVRFTTPVNIRDYVSVDPTRGAFTLEAVSPAKLHGVLLHIDDSTMTRRLIRHYLRDTQLEIVNAETADEGVKRCVEGFDMVLCDHELPCAAGPSILEQLRTAGLTCPIIMLTADSRSALAAAGRSSRASAYLQLPVSQEHLLRAMAEFLLTDNNSADAGGPVCSTLDADHPNAGLVGEYVDDLRKKGAELGTALTAEDAAVIRRICSDIKSVAAEFGFGTAAEAADGAVTALDASGSTIDSMRRIRVVMGICLRARLK